MAPAILFDRVWKKFRRGQPHDSLRDLIPDMVRRWTRGLSETTLAPEEFWAVQDLTFEVHPGEALAIIGPNGAGKSTSLKLLSRILRPNRGRSEVRGRVGALIEVAAGFHPDLTGRENVFLQGAIMGMTRAEIRRHFDEIIEFADMSDFIDTPVKRYSSGMNARLGFSIAAHLEPNVLLIDEVLSVGDMAFQQKCITRAKEFKKEGVAIVFVSHNLQAVTDLCDTSLYLAGKPRAYGPTDDVLSKYIESLAVTENTKGPLHIVSSQLLGTDGAPLSHVVPGDALRLRIAYEAHADLSDVMFGFRVYRSTDNLRVYEGHFDGAELGIPHFSAGESFTIDFDFVANLTRGHYYVDTFVIHKPRQNDLARSCPAAVFAVSESRTHGGVADLSVRARSFAPAGSAAPDPMGPVQLAAAWR